MNDVMICGLFSRQTVGVCINITLNWLFNSTTKSTRNSNAEPNIIRSFRRNMNRVRGLGILPIQLVASATMNEAARMEALANKKVPFHDPRITQNDPQFDPKLFKEVDEERMRIARNWLDQNPTKLVILGMMGLNHTITSGDEDTFHSVQALMAAMLIGLWTAFESLAQDTWISAVNACPNP